ncbi:MAG: 50S ribosomal protein L17 [Ignavibacteria bacterium RBG_13_36_8]|nr:MAG: 50S ribosomal protein L17 [Ignavibacteria bacterium RBG_13_36_8]
MRHRDKVKKLGRTASHRLATLRSLATSLFVHKKIKTTLAKAKAARSFAEPIITRARENTLHARRYVSRHIHDRSVVQELFNEILPKIGERPGGYTRVVKLGQRKGDASEMAILELVDYNELLAKQQKKKKEAKEKEAKEKETKGKDKLEAKEEAVEEAKVAAEKPKAKKKTVSKKKETEPKEKKAKVKKETKEKKTEEEKDKKAGTKKKSTAKAKTTSSKSKKKK